LEFAKNIDFENIVEYARSKNYEYTFLIEIYYRALMTILIPDETSHFDKLRELYKMYYNSFTLSEKRTILHWLVNYCFHCRQFNEIKYSRIIFELNEFRLKEGLAFYPENQIPSTIYFQILNTALEVKETKWAENFIKNYSSKLQAEIRESQKAMAYALLHFETREYEKVLKNLNNIEFDDLWDKLKARIITAKTYYEISETESLLNYIDSSFHFLAKNPSLSDVVRTSYRNFFNSLRKIISIKENSDLDSIPLLRNEIEQIKGIESKIWLLKKLDELENNG
jgi:hypothetical protein